MNDQNIYGHLSSVTALFTLQSCAQTNYQSIWPNRLSIMKIKLIPNTTLNSMLQSIPLHVASCILRVEVVCFGCQELPRVLLGSQQRIHTGCPSSWQGYTEDKHRMPQFLAMIHRGYTQDAPVPGKDTHR